MSTMIRVENLSKRYWIAHQSRARYGALRDDLAAWAAAPFRALARTLGDNRRTDSSHERSHREEFWALKDLSFDVKQGEVVGIIGANGAGKSTLLKVLSRITEPTTGRIEISGRVASLLEVGTGFHPELTGRENIFLNGAILGMPRAQIREKLDEIVAFAEVERFLDTPVKRFSSGMYVRLAFAVAAHLEPEILIVDEVLAVGDAQFQKKCLGKMHDVSSKEGRTVLFVSHQMGTVRQLCNRAILLKGGRIAETGPTDRVIQSYVEGYLGRNDTFVADAAKIGSDIAIEVASVRNRDNQPTASFVHTDEIVIQIKCLINRYTANAELRLVVEDSRGRRVFTSDIDIDAPSGGERRAFEAHATIPGGFLRPETYVVSLYTFVANQFVIQGVRDALSFVIQDGGSKYASSEGLDYGCVFSPCEWKVLFPDGTNRNVAGALARMKEHNDQAR